MANSLCCTEAGCTRKQPIRVLYSALTGSFYVLTRHKQEGQNITASVKHNVTKDVQKAIVYFAGDIWSDLKDLRATWEKSPRASLIEEHIKTFEEGIGSRGREVSNGE